MLGFGEGARQELRGRVRPAEETGRRRSLPSLAVVRESLAVDNLQPVLIAALCRRKHKNKQQRCRK